MNAAKATTRVAGETASIRCYVSPANAAAANQFPAAGGEIVHQNAADKAASDEKVADEALAQMIAERDIDLGIEAAATANRMITAKDIRQNAAIDHEAAAVRRTAVEAALEGVALNYSEEGTANEATVVQTAVKMMGTATVKQLSPCT